MQLQHFSCSNPKRQTVLAYCSIPLGAEQIVLQYRAEAGRGCSLKRKEQIKWTLSESSDPYVHIMLRAGQMDKSLLETSYFIRCVSRLFSSRVFPLKTSLSTPVTSGRLLALNRSTYLLNCLQICSPSYINGKWVVIAYDMRPIWAVSPTCCIISVSKQIEINIYCNSRAWTSKVLEANLTYLLSQLAFILSWCYHRCNVVKRCIYSKVAGVHTRCQRRRQHNSSSGSPWWGEFLYKT